jgi:ABC-type Fe3+/spermidine/putrescine transport system ATPase subunit
MNATIEIDGLRKRFGPVQALDGMTFTVRPGQVTGFVGPNGAGKSTTMRVVVGLDAPDAGSATIGGRPYRSLQNPLRHVGTLLDAGALQPSRRARNHLLWLAHSQGLSAARVDEVIADTSVTDLIAAASGNRSTLRTSAPGDAVTALAAAGAEVTATGPGELTVSNLSSERIVATLAAHAIPFSEVTAYRATLEEAYMELTRESVEYRAEATS